MKEKWNKLWRKNGEQEDGALYVDHFGREFALSVKETADPNVLSILVQHCKYLQTKAMLFWISEAHRGM